MSLEDFTPSQQRQCINIMRELFVGISARVEQRSHISVDITKPQPLETVESVRAHYPNYDASTDHLGLAPRVHLALQALLEDYEKQGKALPPIVSPHTSESIARRNEFSARWAEAMAQEPHWPVYRGTLRPIDNDCCRSQVKDTFFVRFGDDRDWVFRRLVEGDESSLRERFAADLLNELLGIDSSSRSFFAIVNGERGLLSSFVPGLRPLLDQEDHVWRYLNELIGQHQLSLASLSDAYAYLFLVNNADVHLGNFGIDEGGKLRVFDHNFAWDPAIPFVHNSILKAGALGQDFPPRYTPHFVRALKLLTPELIRQQFAPYLIHESLEALLFRRELILKDIELRGDSALFH